MKTHPNRFFHGYSDNKENLKSKFSHFIIETVKHISDYEGGSILETVRTMEDYYLDDQIIGDAFYHVYGVYKSSYKNSSVLISEIDRLADAILLVENLTGNTIIETDVPVYKIPD